MRWGIRLASGAVGALVLIAALEFAEPGWLEELTHGPKTGHRQSAPRVSAQHAPASAPVLVTPPRPLGNDSSVSRVPQPLILVRTQLGRNSREGFAQIGINARSPQTYAAGALLVNGARLTEIHERYVVLERDGHSERLYVQGEAPPASSPQRAVAAGLLTVGGPSAEPPPPVTSQEPLTDYVRPSPVYVNGQLHGYALYAGRKARVFSLLGLQSGDVVTQINGTAVSANSDSLETLESLTKGEALSVVVERQGVAQTLSLDGAALQGSAAAAPWSFPKDSPGASTRL
jgi:hypothetical protein